MASLLSRPAARWLRYAGLRSWVLGRVRADGLRLPPAQVVDFLDAIDQVAAGAADGSPDAPAVDLSELLDPWEAATMVGLPSAAALVALRRVCDDFPAPAIDKPRSATRLWWRHDVEVWLAAGARAEAV